MWLDRRIPRLRLHKTECEARETYQFYRDEATRTGNPEIFFDALNKSWTWLVMKAEKRLAREEDYKQADLIPQDKRFVPRYDYEDPKPKKPEKPKVRLGYEHLHRGNKDFERVICRDDFVSKYSQYYNIMQFMHVFRSRNGLRSYDPLPEGKLNAYIAEETPFESWQEFLVAAYEQQATTDEIDALLDRDYHAA